MKGEEEDRTFRALRERPVLESSSESALHRITDLAAHLLDAPIALVVDVPTTLVSFIDADPEWASFWESESSAAAPASALCAHTLPSDEVTVIEDATDDERLRDHPWVTGEPGIRFYASAPLTTPAGQRVGTLCVLDTEARSVPERTVRQLGHLAQVMEDELEPVGAPGETAFATASAAEQERMCFRALLQESPMPMCVFDLDTNHFLAVNDAAVAHYGFSEEEFRSMQITDIRTDDPAPALPQDDASPAARLQTHRLKNGQEAIMEVRTHTVGFEGHSAALAVARDVTDEYERRLQREEEQARLQRHHRMFAQLAERTRAVWGDFDRVLRAITEVAGEGLNVDRVNVWRYETAPRRIVCLDRYDRAAQAHIDKETLTVDACPSYFNAFADDRVTTIEDVRTDPRTAQFGLRYFQKNNVISLAAAPVRVGESTIGVLAFEGTDAPRSWTADEEILLGSLADFVALALESADRKEAETALRESEERLEMALSAANLGSWDWKVQTGHVRYDERWADMLGVDLDEIDPHIDTWKERIHPDDQETVRNAIQPHLAGDTDFYEVEHRLRAKDGSWQWILSRGRVVERDDEGNPLRVVGTHLDITERKERASVVQRFGRLLDASAAEFYVFRADTLQFVQVSRGARQHLGYDEDALLSMMPTDITPLDRSDLEARLDPLREGVRRMVTFETEQKRADGSTYPVQVQVQFSRQETPPVFIAVVLDITEQKDAEKALHESMQRYKLLAEHAGDVVMLHDASGRAVWVSPSSESVLDRPPEAILDNSFYSYIHPEDEDTVRSYLRRVLQGEDPDPALYRARQADGAYVWLEMLGEAICNDQGDFTQVVSSSRDVTERKQAEDQLSREEEFLQKLFDAIPVMITVYDPNRDDFRVNKEFERVLGWTNEDAEESNLMEAVYPDPGYREEATRFMEVPGAGWDDFVVHTKEGKEVHCSWSNIRLSDGTLVGIGIDLTERKQLEAQLRHAQKMETVGTLVGGVAHHFNNILHAAIVYLQMALEDLPPDSSATTFLEETEEGLHDAADLVSELLTFSRQEGKAVEVSVDLAEIAEESIDLVEPSLPPDVQVRTAIEEGSMVAGDPSQLRQVAMNIMTNAAQAMEEHGPEDESVLDVDVRTTDVDRDLANRYLNLSPGRYVRLSISDTGPGMDPETRDRIFEPFFTTKEEARGTGLGLSVVHGIVQAHDGEITVFTEPGEGTTFNVYIPRSASDDALASEEDAQAEGAYESADPGMNGHILFIDDDEQVLELETVRLQRLGYQVTTQQSAQSALQEIEDDPQAFDLVLTDYAMPGMSGLDLAREVKRISDLPVVLMSGFSAQVSEDEARRAGVKTFLRKPVGSGELRSVLAELV